MIDPHDFYVVTVGRRYLSCDAGLSQVLEEALRFELLCKAIEHAKLMHEAALQEVELNPTRKQRSGRVLERTPRKVTVQHVRVSLQWNPTEKP